MGNPSWFNLYSKLPVPAQNLCCTIAGLKRRRERYNRTFHDVRAFLEQSQWWPFEQQCELQNEKLRELIRHAYASTPYYREIMDARSLRPDDIQCVEDLPKLPLLDKETTRQRGAEMVSTTWPAKRIYPWTTGGTTGTALKLSVDRDAIPWRFAVWWRHRGRFGLKPHDPYVNFLGRAVVSRKCMKPPFWRRNYALNQTMVSVHHMTRDNLPYLVDYLQQRQVAYYAGYPSGLYLLAAYLLEHDIHLDHPPRICSTGAESVLPHIRETIESGLDTEVADQYGAAEGVGNISQCERHFYHVDMEFGIIEFLPIEGMPSNVRRVVATGLRNPAMPLIRYEIGDVVTLADRPCPCGRQAPAVLSIDGRIESFIVTPDGRQLGRLNFLFKQTATIKEAQLIQEVPDRLLVKIVRHPAYSQKDEDDLRADIHSYVGSQMHIDFEYTESIPREPNGKLRMVVSKVAGVAPRHRARGGSQSNTSVAKSERSSSDSNTQRS